MKLRRASLAACASLFFLGATQAAPTTLAADAAAFGPRDTTHYVDISPSGQRMLEIVSAPGRASVLRVFDANGTAAKPILRAAGDKESLYWCAFASDEQLICKYGGLVRLDGQIIGFSRIAKIGADGKNYAELGQRSRATDARIRQFAGEVLDWMPHEPGSVLMARAYVPEVGTTGTRFSDQRSGMGVDRIDLRTLKLSRVEPARDSASRFLTDGRGTVRIVAEDEKSMPERILTGVINYKYRTADSKAWRELGRYNSVDGSGMYPLAIDGPANTLYFLEALNGRDALYRMPLDGSGQRSLVASNPKVDIRSVVRLGRGQKVIGYTFIDDRRRVVYFDPELQKVAAGLAKALPKQPLIEIMEASADGNTLLVYARGDAHPGSYYRFDRRAKQLTEIAVVNDRLQGRTLANVRQVMVPGSGGVQVPAYLTLPVGSTGKNLPAVVLPHGGPTARDEWGFDWLSQFLAARGYAVIQPNFRGSSGYGADWLGENALKDWRTAISDISASARYLTDQGIADPQRMAIVGWSYGGYAALQSAAVDPGLYQAAVAIAPVTDLALLKQQSAGFTNNRLVREMIGTGEHLATGSPLQRAGDIKVPVLMFHGDMDANVDVSHSQRMASALTSAGRPVEFVRFADLDHQIDDDNARVQMLTKIGQFLEQKIGK